MEAFKVTASYWDEKYIHLQRENYLSPSMAMVDRETWTWLVVANGCLPAQSLYPLNGSEVSAPLHWVHLIGESIWRDLDWVCLPSTAPKCV